MTASCPRAASEQLKALLVDESRRGAELFLRSRQVVAGANGSYGDPETPLRNMSHWLYSFCQAYASARDAELRDAAELATEILVKAVSLFRGSVNVRLSATKDTSNGVLGQAHLIEGLWCAWTVFGNREARATALSLAERHPFDRKNYCWHRLTPTGKAISPDFTFNHQLYFAGVLAYLRSDSSIVASALDEFLSGLDSTFAVYPDGLIKHNIPNRTTLAARAKSFAAEAKRTRFGSKRSKEYNYHSYNMYAFALLQDAGVQLPDRAQARWRRAATLLQAEKMTKLTSREVWGGALPSGGETVCADFAYFSRLNDPEQHALYVERSLEFIAYHVGPTSEYALFSPDPYTQVARTYRYWRAI